MTTPPNVCIQTHRVHGIDVLRVPPNFYARSWYKMHASFIRSHWNYSILWFFFFSRLEEGVAAELLTLSNQQTTQEQTTALANLAIVSILCFMNVWLIKNMKLEDIHCYLFLKVAMNCILFWKANYSSNDFFFFTESKPSSECRQNHSSADSGINFNAATCPALSPSSQSI